MTYATPKLTWMGKAVETIEASLMKASVPIDSQLGDQFETSPPAYAADE